MEVSLQNDIRSFETMTKVMYHLHVLCHAESDPTRRLRKHAADFGSGLLPKGSKILEKAAMLAANCRTAGLEGLELRI